MANDNQIESHHRKKHHRSSSSSDEADKSSKRHKHRHHHKRHHKRHRRDRKREDEIPSGEDEAEPMDATPIGVSDGGGDDVEEGEILDEQGLANVKTLDSEIKSDQIQDNDLTSNGVLTRESTREDKRLYKESGGLLERVGKTSYDNGRSSFSSDNSEDKHKSSNRSLTESRQCNEVRARSRSKSHDREREISRSRVVAEEDEFSVRGRHRDSSREYRHDRVDYGRTVEKYHRRGRYEEDDRGYTREVKEGERSKEREGSVRDRDSEVSKRRERDSDRRSDRGREKRREIEADRERGKDRERESSIDRDRRRERGGRDRDNERGMSVNRERRREREGDYLRDRDNGRGRSRDRTRYDSRERMREKERESDKDRGKGKEIQADSEKFKSVEVDDSERSKNENNKDDNDKEFIWKSPEEIEEEELNKIRESIEKFKKKSEQQSELISQDKGKGVVKKSSAPDSASSVVGDVAKTSLTAGGPPTMPVISNSEKTQAPAGLGEGSPKSERSADMFHDDIFGESPAANHKVAHMRGKGDGVPMVRSGLHDNWDDAEGYYSYQFGELIDGRYEVIATHGKGVFSTVVRAKDLKAGPAEPDEVAIKIIRNNETMHKAGQTEVQILKKLAGADQDDKRHCVRLLSSFKYRNHLCLVFESLHLNLREVLKKFGRNIGLKLSAVRSYSKQLFIALKHLKNCGVLHCDIKPDNMLVNENKTVLKLCDFGNAMFAGKNEVTPYLVSRFYRSPEIILGLAYDHPLDIWSVGCCLYELYCGKVLFPGATNNDMLRLHMELKGLFPKKMLRKGAFIDQNFDHDLNFYATEEDTVSGKMMKRMIVNVKPKDFGSIIKGYPGEDPKMVAHFRDLLDKMFILDPEKRLTVSQALAHPFITGK
ncbi:Protein kinase superfamily protein [Raphanus sativus]|uniref:Serine/threonine-protein kinase PRP4 homolog n=1 Tax=Raphanus sativus TaxID=3726 RepID=A0A6J0NGR0_RAPSA|nr:serine/threonine-protein kinase prp4 [Raphanus sativus]KAJ4901134.1 Protein kinase superfamily protein [Raphanus sativus]